MKKHIPILLVLLFSGIIPLMAQNPTLTGKVKNQNGKAVEGAVVKTATGETTTTTDVNGNFSISLAVGNHKLIINAKDYQEATEVVSVTAGQTSLRDFTINTSSEGGEVVVIGYGTTTKRDLTGSVTSLKGADVQDMPTSSFEAAIQGKAPGVQITTGSGVAGSGTLVRIRGVASISAAGDPLYIVDGIPISQNYFVNGNNGGFNNNPLATLNPEDIESIEILKDAAATSIYGSRGSNGVILISTKRAKKGGLKFDFTSRLGTSQPTFRPEMLNSKQLLQMYQEAWENDGGTGRAPLPNNISWEEAEKTNTNWVDETMGMGIKQMYSLGTTYRKNKLGVYMGLTHDNNGSFVIGSRYKRNSARLNLDYEPIKNLTLSLSSSYTQGVN
ncbi:MAG: TonB-dependent receptor plug domain-containing protein, partial [Sphingomonadales bacterium]